MKKLLIFSMISLLISCQSKEITSTDATTIKLAFGSCSHQDKPQPMLEVATELKPDAFVYLGDNIYGDTKDVKELKNKYVKLFIKPEFQALRAATTVYATWDDHDYGENDAGRHYPMKAESKEVFMDFWKVPKNDDRRQHEGIYDVKYLEKDDLKVQLIILDTRTFRDNLIKRTASDTDYKNDYAPNQNADSTFLGKEQWAWLETQLKAPADVRVIASSNQFSHEYNGWESWTNVPKEQEKMINLIKTTKANGVVFISGDVHWGEVSKLEGEEHYPIYDVTSSGITETWDKVESNTNRVGAAVPQNNVGLLDIKKYKGKVGMSLMIFDETQKAVVKHYVPLKEISF